MAKKRPRGRPRKAEGEALDAVFQVRLRPDERELVRAAAQKAGEPASAWARKRLVAAAKRQR